MIRVGIVGAGQNTQIKHIPNLKNIEDVQVVSVCNRSRGSAEDVAGRFGIPQIYDTWQELVTAADTDAIVIGTWPNLHCPVTLSALKAGKHVLVEARMAMNLNEARQMLHAARRSPNLVTQIVPAPFSLHVDPIIQRLIADDYLGDILAIEVRSSNGQFLDLNSPLHWRQDLALSGMNIMSLGIWYETIMRWVGEAKSVMAVGKVFKKMRLDPENGQMIAVRIPETISVLADMVCGAQANFSISNVNGLYPEKSVLLFGSQGTLWFADGRLFGGRRGDSSLVEIAVNGDEQSAWRVEEEFVNAIRGQGVIENTPFDVGVKYMAFTEAVNRSIRENRMVLVESNSWQSW